MRTLQINISETDFRKYNLAPDQVLKFTDLVEKISMQYAKQSLLKCNEIAERVGLSAMTLEEINTEIKAVRDAKNNR